MSLQISLQTDRLAAQSRIRHRYWTRFGSSHQCHFAADRLGTSFLYGVHDGEHGNSQMIPWSTISFHGKPLDQMDGEQFHFDHADMVQRVIKGGWVTFQGKHCTEYGISSTAATIVRSILHDEKKIMPVSAYLDGQYGESGICIGVPAVIGKDGVELVMEYKLPEDEKQNSRNVAIKFVPTSKRRNSSGNKSKLFYKYTKYSLCRWIKGVFVCVVLPLFWNVSERLDRADDRLLSFIYIVLSVSAAY